MDRRIKLEKDPPAWLKWYIAEAYTRPFDRAHFDIISGVMQAHETGGRFVVAAERGIGKSAIFYGMVLFLKLSGLRLFPVYLPWSAPIMKRGLSFWRNALSFRSRLLADYPEYCAPFAQARGISQRLSVMRWEDTEQPCGALMQISDGMIVMPDSCGAIGGSTVNGNPRGMNLPREDGSILRPDLALVDDPQDRKVSKSATLVSETCCKIDQDISGLGTAGADFPILMSGNCIIADDVMDRYLHDSNWRPLRISCVEQWPEGWQDNGPTYKLWLAWWDAFRIDPARALELYAANKDAMIKGMALSSPHAYSLQISQYLPDEYCVAMRQYWQMGHASFYAERQQTPVSTDDLAPYKLTWQLICSRADPSRKVFEQPEYARAVVTVGTDINHYGLHSSMCGFGNDSTGACLWHGCYKDKTVPPNCNEALRKSIIFDMLTAHGRQIRSCATRPDCWLIDGGYELETVMRYVRAGEGRDMPFRIYVARGYPADRYKPYGKFVIGTAREQCHLTEWPSGRGIAFNADYWREIMQRAWLAEIGQPGGMSLYAGDHRDYAEQICREKLREKLQGSSGIFYKWDTAPGWHDDGDAMTMCYVGASFERGIGPGSASGSNKQQTPAPRRQRVSVISI